MVGYAHVFVLPFTLRSFSNTVRDKHNLEESHKYVCITAYEPDTKSYPNPNPTTKQHATVNIQLVACPTYPYKFIRDMLLHRLFDFRL